nr:MAG TPA: hypothetical protein [Caudoviricetes sp.]
MNITIICPKIHKEENHLQNSKYNEGFFDEFSIRDWVSWDTESGFEMFYEDSEIIKKIKIKNGL